MTPEEINEKHQYADYQEIKQANGGHENKELEYKMKRTAAILESLGVNV